MGQAAHLRNYITIPECEVAAIAEPRPILRDAVARKYGIDKTYATGEEMIAAEELDGIVAIQQFAFHGTIIPPLYAAGVPVFTEKPLAISLPVAERMLSALAESGTWQMVGYHRRSDPATMYAKDEIDRLKTTKELGALKYVRISVSLGDWVAGGFRDVIRTDEPVPLIEPDVPRGSDKAFKHLMNSYSHQINLLRHLLGEPYTVGYADPSGVVLAGSSQSGVPGVIEFSPYKTTLDWQETAFVAFERGWIKIALPPPVALNRPGQVEIFRDPGDGQAPEHITPTLPSTHAMYQQAVNFIRAIKGEAEPPCTAQEAMLDLVNARQYMNLLEKQECLSNSRMFLSPPRALKQPQCST